MELDKNFIKNIRSLTIDDIKSAANKIKLSTIYFLEGSESEEVREE